MTAYSKVLCVLCALLSFTAFGGCGDIVGAVALQPDSTSVEVFDTRDFVRQAYMAELDFSIDCIENRYVSGRRGIGDEEWQQWVETVGNRADVFFDDYDGYYVYIWKYLGLLQGDSHFSFPDGGMFNREGCFTDDDIILPLWVQTWEDGTVYNVKDYTGRIPKYAEIVCINGYSAE